MTTLTDAELARLEELAAKANLFAVIVPNNATPRRNKIRMGMVNEVFIGTGTPEQAASDLEYISAACNAVPSLVAEVRRLRETVDTNAMLYMDVTTVCPDCTMQGKPSDGCQLCEGRGRAFLHDVLRRGNAELETLRDAGEGLENDGYMANAFGGNGQGFPFPPYSQSWWEAVALNATRLAQENAALRERIEALEWLVEVMGYDFWNSQPDTVSKFTPQFGNASLEYDRTYYAAREAIS